MPIRPFKQFVRRNMLALNGVREQAVVNEFAAGGWTICTDGIDADSVVYSFGVGGNIEWDLELIKRFGLVVHGFDPTQRTVDWMKTQNTPDEFVFHPIGIAAHDGTIDFHPPRAEGKLNYSPIDRGKEYAVAERVEAPVARLSTIAADLGHDHVDILKMDIEGGEYDVLQDILREDFPVRQILVEFHHAYATVPFRKTTRAIRKLRVRGYEIFHISPRTYEFSFIRR